MTLLKFEKFDFLTPSRPNLHQKLKCASIFMKTDTVTTLFTHSLCHISLKLKDFQFLVPNWALRCKKLTSSSNLICIISLFSLKSKNN